MLKVLKIKFSGIPMFSDNTEIDFTASDLVFEGSLVPIYNTIYRQNIVGIIGVNAVGKTSLLRVIGFVLEILINNRNLNDLHVNPLLFVNGAEIETVFFNNNKFYQLTSTIGITNNEGESELFYKNEILKIKSKSSVKSRKNVFDFSGSNVEIIKRKDRTNIFLKDGDSIAIIGTVDNTSSVKNLLHITNKNFFMTTGETPSDVVGLFDDNIEYLKVNKKILSKKDFNSDDNVGCELKFKNSDDSIELSDAFILEELISSGTIKGNNLIINALKVLKSGGYLIVDELESHLNKRLVKVIMDLFMDSEFNSKGATLIFTTHYAEVLDFMDRKDNIFIITRKRGELSKIVKYSDEINRNELKKSEVILSNRIEGSAPRYEDIIRFKKFVAGAIRND